MLEIIDASVPLLIKALDSSINLDSVIYADRSFALRLRQDKLSQSDAQQDVVPFISYFRASHKIERFNQRLNKVGIPYDNNSTSPGRLTYTPVQPMSTTYDVTVWEKDGIKNMEWLKTWYSRYLKIQNVTIFIDDEVSYTLNAQLSTPVEGFYNDSTKRLSFMETGQLFLFNFKILVMGAIPDIKVQSSKYRIEVIKVNYELEKEILKQEFSIDNNGQVIKLN